MKGGYKKITDNEIIKFIEHAINSAKSEDGFKEIYWKKLDYILDLINRQKAKIEALQMDNKQLQSDVINANQNWDHIKGLWECEKEKIESAKQKVICACKMLKTAKSEAIKEFAERLKGKIWHSPECNYINSITPDYIDNLVKEMTE